VPAKSAKSRPRRYATLTEAAEILRCKPKTVRHMIAEGRLTGYRFGNRVIRVDLDELDNTLRPIQPVKKTG
jgi:excisionase family DNA binding protein